MIASLTGKIKTIQSGALILDVGGVGYEIHISSKTMQDLSITDSVDLEIYTHVREDILKLYGFSSSLEKKLFIAFIGINGVGPKMALSVLSAAASLDILVEMIEKKDIKGLSGLPRVGKKIAQQIILNLKGSLPTSTATSGQIENREWLSRALVNLGFRAAEIRAALDRISVGQDRRSDLKKALAYLQPGP